MLTKLFAKFRKRQDIVQLMYLFNVDNLDSTILLQSLIKPSKEEFTKNMLIIINNFINKNFIEIKDNIEYFVVRPYKLYWLIKLYQILKPSPYYDVSDLLVQVVRVLIDKEEKRYIKIKDIKFFLQNLDPTLIKKYNKVILTNYNSTLNVNLLINELVDEEKYRKSTLYNSYYLFEFINKEYKDCKGPVDFLMKYNPFERFSENQPKVQQHCRDVTNTNGQKMKVVLPNTPIFNNIYNSNQRQLIQNEYNKIFPDISLNSKNKSSNRSRRSSFQKILGRTIKKKKKQTRKGIFARFFRKKTIKRQSSKNKLLPSSNQSNTF
jgi:hypothetical protein